MLFVLDIILQTIHRPFDALLHTKKWQLIWLAGFWDSICTLSPTHLESEVMFTEYWTRHWICLFVASNLLRHLVASKLNVIPDYVCRCIGIHTFWMCRNSQNFLHILWTYSISYSSVSLMNKSHVKTKPSVASRCKRVRPLPVYLQIYIELLNNLEKYAQDESNARLSDAAAQTFCDGRD